LFELIFHFNNIDIIQTSASKSCARSDLLIDMAVVIGLSNYLETPSFRPTGEIFLLLLPVLSF